MPRPRCQGGSRRRLQSRTRADGHADEKRQYVDCEREQRSADEAVAARLQGTLALHPKADTLMSARPSASWSSSLPFSSSPSLARQLAILELLGLRILCKLVVDHTGHDLKVLRDQLAHLNVLFHCSVVNIQPQRSIEHFQRRLLNLSERPRFMSPLLEILRERASRKNQYRNPLNSYNFATKLVVAKWVAPDLTSYGIRRPL
jgi:hypothetical protein